MYYTFSCGMCVVDETEISPDWILLVVLKNPIRQTLSDKSHLGGIGRRRRFKLCCLRAYRFKSDR